MKLTELTCNKVYSILSGHQSSLSLCSSLGVQGWRLTFREQSLFIYL